MKKMSIFDVLNYIFLAAFSLLCLFPFLNVLAKALSAEHHVLAGTVSLWPKGLNFTAFQAVLESPSFQRSFLVSFLVTITGTIISVLLTSLVAYAASHRHYRPAKLISILYIVTMLFSGGMIPTYLVVRYTGLINSLWALILPGAVSAFNMILTRNYMEGLPPSLEESAQLDGAGNLTCFFKIILPVCKPVLATIAIYYAVGFWNNYMSAIMYINKQSLRPLQMYLRELVLGFDSSLLLPEAMMNIPKESIRSATVILTALPILVVYPFMQRHFVKGVVLGSVKE